MSQSQISHNLSIPVFAAIGLLTLLTGCGRVAQSDGQDKPAPEKVATPKSVRLGYFPNITHAQAVLGVVRGDFQRELGPDIMLEPSTYNAGPSVIFPVFAGNLDIAYVGPSPIINGFQQSRGEEIRVIAGAAANGVLIIGNKKRGITRLDQLRGKKIASPQLGNTQDLSAKEFVVAHLNTELKERGGDTEVVPMSNPDIETLFAKDQLDAAWVPEPWGSRIIDKGLAVLIEEEKNLWPGKSFALTNVIVRRDFMEKHPDLVKRFLRAHIRLTNDLKADPGAYAETINKELKRLTSKTLSPAVIAGSLKYTSFTVDPSRESFARFFEMGKTLKLVRGDSLDIDKLIVPGPLMEVLAEQRAGASGTSTTQTEASK